MKKHKEIKEYIRLGPSRSSRPRAWFGPKENTKIQLRGYIGSSESIYFLNISREKDFNGEKFTPPRT